MERQLCARLFLEAIFASAFQGSFSVPFSLSQTRASRTVASWARYRLPPGWIRSPMEPPALMQDLGEVGP